MIQTLHQQYSVTFLCNLLNVNRSSYYYQPNPLPARPEIITAVEAILMRWPFYGYRRVYHQLKREGWVAGENQVRHILKWLGVSRQVGKVRVQTTDSNHHWHRYPNLIKGVKPQRPNLIWVADLTYIRYGRDFIYLAVILDACSRAVRGWHLSEYLTCQALTRPALEMALANGTPRIFHSDQGSQYAAWHHLEPLIDRGVEISMSETGQPTQNGLVERFIGLLKQEHVAYTEYETVEDARLQLKNWLEGEYMTERIHSSLGYLTPAEFERIAWLQPHQPLLCQ